MSELERLTEFLRGSSEPWEPPWFRPEDLLWHSYVELQAVRVRADQSLHAALTDAFELLHSNPRLRLAFSQLWLTRPQTPLESTFWRLTRDKEDFLLEPDGLARLRVEVLEPSRLEPARKAFQAGAAPVELAQLLEQTIERRPVAMLVPSSPAWPELVAPQRMSCAFAWLAGQSYELPDAGWQEPVWGVAPSVEQRAVTELVHRHPVVVVQGGPGSGKTHLAVALAGHALARGQRVLVAFPTVTSQKVFQNRLASMLAQPLAPGGDLVKLQSELEEAELDLFKRVAQEQGSHAADTARAVVQLKSQHDWLAGPLLTVEVPLSDAELDELYGLCSAKSELDAPRGKMPEPGDLMPPQDLARLNDLEQDLGLSNDTCWARETPPESLDPLLESGRQLFESLQGQEDWWVQCAWSAFCSDDARKRWGQLSLDMDKSRKDRAHLERLVREHEPKLSPDLGEDEQIDICYEILEHLLRGGSLKGVSTAFKGRWKKILKGARVQGHSPAAPEDFRALVASVHLGRLQMAEHMRLLEELEKVRYPAPRAQGDPIDDIRRALRWPLERFAPFEKQARQAGLMLDKAAPPPNETASLADLRHLERFLEKELEELIRRRRLWLERTALTEKARATQLALARFPEVGKDLLKALNDRNQDEYRVGLEKLAQWKRRIPLMDRRESLLARLEAGAPGWARCLRERRAPHHTGQIPGDAHQAWEYRLQRDLLDAWEKQDIDAMHQEVAARRRRLEQAYRAGLPRQAKTLEVGLLDQLSPSGEFDLVLVDGAQRADIHQLGLLMQGQRVVLLADSRPIELPPPAEGAARRARQLLGCLGVASGQESLLEVVGRAPVHRLTRNYRSRADLCLHMESEGPGRPPRVAVAPVVPFDLRGDWRHPAALATALLRTPEYPFYRLALVVEEARLGQRIRRFLDRVLSSSERGRLRCGTLAELEGEEFDLVLASDRRAFGLAREQVWLLGSPLTSPVEPGLHPESALSLKVVERLLEGGYRLHASLYGIRVEGEGGAVLLHVYGEDESREALSLESWLEQHLGWNHLRVWPSRFFQNADKSLATLTDRLKGLGLTAWRPLAIHPVEEKAQFLLDGWGAVKPDLVPERPAALESFGPSSAWQDVPPPRPELVAAEPDLSPVTTVWPQEPVGQARSVVATPRPAEAPDPASARLPGPVVDAWPAQPVGLPRAQLPPPSAEAWPSPELASPSAEARREPGLAPGPPPPSVQAWPSSPSGPEPLPPSVSAWPAEPVGLPLPHAGAWPAQPAGLPRPQASSPPAGGLPHPSAEAWPDQPWGAPPSEPRPRPRPPSFAQPQEVPATAAEPGSSELTAASSAGQDLVPPPGAVGPVGPTPQTPDATELAGSVKPELSRALEVTEPAKPRPPRGESVKAKPPRALEVAQSVHPGPSQAVEPAGSVKSRLSEPGEASEPVKVKPPRGLEPAEPVKVKPPKALESAEPGKARPPEAIGPRDPSAGKQAGALQPTGPGKAKPPREPAEPSKAKAKPLRAEQAQPAEKASSVVQKPGPHRLGRPEFGQRLEFSVPAGRPPAPNPRRPAPPRAARPAPRKSLTPPPAPVTDDEAANVMLQAFELLRQVDAGALAELAEGVTGVEMKRAGREARRAPRLVCLYEVNCQIGTRRFPAVVSEISLTGVRLDLPESLARDTIVVLRPELQQSDLGGVRCSVRWCRRTPREGLTAGLAFQETPEHLSRSWVAQLLHSLGFGAGHQRRRSLRVQTRVPTEIISSGGEGVGKTMDLGIGGLQLQTSMRLEVGEEIDLMLGPTEGLQRVGFRGVVVNARGTKSLTYGVRFEAPQPGQIRALGAYLLHCLGRNAEE